MKKLCTEILTAAFLGLVVPWMLLNAVTRPVSEVQESSAPAQNQSTIQEFLIPVLMPDGSFQRMKLDTYLTT